MKAFSTYLTAILIGLLLTQILSCSKVIPQVEPTVTASSVNNITSTSATAIGEVTSDGGAEVTSKGFCWSPTNSAPTTSDSKISAGSGKGNFSTSISGLNQGTTYNLRAFATNSVGTAYSGTSTFKTTGISPTITTTDISSTTATSLMCGGNISNDGGSPVTARGVCWSTNQNPTISDNKTSNGTGTGNFTTDIVDLLPGVTYYLRAYATNDLGTSYGNQITAKTAAILPVLTTTSLSNIKTISATGGGSITSDGGGTILARGVCWSTSANPTTTDNKSTDGTGTGTYTSAISGLSANTTYYVRAYATNITGTAYGNQQLFVTNFGTMTDIDGNIYQTIKIGSQVWSTENLKVSKLNDGTPIPLIIDNSGWSNLTSAGYSWYNNDAAANKNHYGGLYNWKAVNTGKLCPTGWHVPSEAEWTALSDYLTNNNFGYQGSGSDIAKSMATTTAEWAASTANGTIGNDPGSNNSSGFSALPGGVRHVDGTYEGINGVTYLWAQSEPDFYGNVNRWVLTYNLPIFERTYGSIYNGFSVRCLSGEILQLSLTTSDVSNITATSAVSGGNISNDGGKAVTNRGVCWSTNTDPTIADNKTSNGTGTGAFVSSISGLTQGRTYYVRAYATNSNGTVYGNNASFSTVVNIPTLTTTTVSSITPATATSGGNISSNGGSSITARGICWSTHQIPTVSDFRTTDGTGTGSFSSTLTGLTANTKYYVRSYATNSAVTTYGNEVSFTTATSIVTLATTPATSITTDSGTSGGNISSDGGGTITARGVCWSTHATPLISDFKTIDGTGIGTYTSTLTGLSPDTKYYIRSYATNAAGTTYGNELSFTTLTGVLYNNTAWIIDENNEYQMVAIHTNNSMIGIKINPEKNTEYTAILRKAASDSPGILVKINSEGLPYQIYVNDNILILGNFTPTSVDIVIIRPNKDNEILRKVNLSQLASLRKFKKSLYVGGEVKASDVISTVGIALSVGTCAVEVAGTFSTGGVLAPMAAIGCGMAIVDVLAAFDPTDDNELKKVYNTNSYVGAAINGFGCTKFKMADCIGVYNASLGFIATFAENLFQKEKDKMAIAYTAFNADSSIPIIDTFPVTNVLSTSAISGVNVVSNGGHAIVAKGVCWSTSPSPTISNNKTSDGAGDAASPSAISGLTPGTRYYVRAYATNSEGTAYGQEISFIAGTWQIVQDDITITGSTKCWNYYGTQKIEYTAQAVPTLWAFKGDIVFTDSGTNLEVYYDKYNDDIITVRQDPVPVKLETSGNIVKLSFAGDFTYEMIGQMNSDKTEINGVGTISQVIPPTSSCEGYTVVGSANCKIIISH